MQIKVSLCKATLWPTLRRHYEGWGAKCRLVPGELAITHLGASQRARPCWVLAAPSAHTRQATLLCGGVAHTTREPLVAMAQFVQIWLTQRWALLI